MQTDLQTDRQTHIATYRAAIAAKNSIIGDIYKVQSYDTSRINNTEIFHLQRPKIFSDKEANKSYTEQVVIDPDDHMSIEWKQTFRQTCEEFTDVINPNPGRYNNSYGDVDCSMDFYSKPPPAVKARLPNYSTDKLKIMGEQMDKMEEMGVLAKPEDVGVIPTFVVPSLLVPIQRKESGGL